MTAQSHAHEPHAPQLNDATPDEKTSKRQQHEEASAVDIHDPRSDQDTVHDAPLERHSSSSDDTQPPAQLTRTASSVGPVYSVFGKNQKRFIVVMASCAGFFSPVSANIYFPALNSLASDLHVSNSLINLTLTTYMVSYLHLC